MISLFLLNPTSKNQPTKKSYKPQLPKIGKESKKHRHPNLSHRQFPGSWKTIPVVLGWGELFEGGPRLYTYKWIVFHQYIWPSKWPYWGHFNPISRGPITGFIASFLAHPRSWEVRGHLPRLAMDLVARLGRVNLPGDSIQRPKKLR